MLKSSRYGKFGQLCAFSYWKCRVELRADALASIGKLFRSLGPHLISRIDELLVIVRDALIQGGLKRNKGNDYVSDALRCVSDMVSGLGAPFHDRVLSLLEPMLQSGLTSELIETLRVVAEFIPSQKEAVQSRLLIEATKILGGDSQLRISEPSHVYSWTKYGKRVGHQAKLKSCGMYDAYSSTILAVNMASIRPTSPAMATRGGFTSTGQLQVPFLLFSTVKLCLFYFKEFLTPPKFKRGDANVVASTCENVETFIFFHSWISI